MSRLAKKNGIPDRWLDYTAVGKRLRGTRFIAFKVPLKQALNHQLPSLDVFGPWELLDALSKQEEELGLIIDLTFTTRYYKVEDIPSSLLCVKIFTQGHEVPSDNTILSFKRAVRGFLRENKDNDACWELCDKSRLSDVIGCFLREDKLIGVHCTHGLNRTGYLICRYLIDVDGMDPKEAMELFNSARGHAMERQNYLQDLQHGPRRSNEGMEEVEQEPTRGQAIHRPLFTSSNDGFGQKRRAHESRYHRPLPPRGMNPHLHQCPPQGGFLPPPPLLPPPPFHPPSLSPYRWMRPQPDGQWRRPPRSEESQLGIPQWRPATLLQEPWRPPPPIFPHYSPRWPTDFQGHEAPEEEWAGPKMRPNVRHAGRNTVNRYDC